jgi:hypothetical protein
MVVQTSEGVEGFVPSQHLEVRGDIKAKAITEEFPLGKKLQARVISYDNFNQVPILTVKVKKFPPPQIFPKPRNYFSINKFSIKKYFHPPPTTNSL